MRGALSREGFPSAQVVVKTRDRYPPARTTSAGTRKARPCASSCASTCPHCGGRTPFMRRDVDVMKVEPYVYCGNITGPDGG
jgi:hypothetical protein